MLKNNLVFKKSEFFLDKEIGLVEKDLEYLKGLKEQYPDNEEIDKYLRKFEKILDDINSD